MYETTTELFLVTNVTGLTTFELPADTAYIVVVTPAEGVITFNGTRTLIDNVTVDYEPVIPLTNTTTTATESTASDSSDDSGQETTSTTSTSPFSSVIIVTISLGTIIPILRKKRKI